MSWEYHYQFWQRMTEPPAPEPAPVPTLTPEPVAPTMEDAELQQKARKLARSWSMLNTSINQHRYTKRWRTH